MLPFFTDFIIIMEAFATIKGVKKRMKASKKFIYYMVKLFFRITIVCGSVYMYLFHKQWMTDFLTKPIGFGVAPLHILWAIFMLIMIMHIFPIETTLRTMAILKAKEETYQPVEGYSEFELLKFVQKQNRAAWMVMLVWLSFNAFWAILYLFHVIGEAELLMLTVFFFLCDYICILFFCPFQTFIMKNKCCVNCRIYDWGHFMMFTPMLFIKNFFSWSLFFTSLIVLIKWEIVYAKHPERFWEGSNRILKCANCKDRTCRIKKLKKSDNQPV